MTLERHLLCCGLAFAGCSSEPTSMPVEECPGPGEEIAGESFDFLAVGHDFSDYWQENLAAAESHADWVAREWGVDPQPFEFWLFESRDDPGVEGKHGEWFMTHHLVELPEDGSYKFTMTTASVERLEMRVEFRNCERDGMASSYFAERHAYASAAFPEDIVRWDFLAGVYVMRVLLKDPPQPEGATLQVSVAAWP